MIARRRRAAAIVLCAAVACSRSPSTTTLTVAVRLVDLIPPVDVPGTQQAADVMLDGETRRVPIAPAEGPAIARLDTEKPFRRYHVDDITPAMQAWGPVVVERPIGGTTMRWSVPVDLRRDPTPRLLVVPTEKAEPVVMVKVYAAPPPERLDVETRPFVVPDGAVLAVALGLHAPTSRAREGAEARIAVRDGDREQDVLRTYLPLSPRGWRDERVSLAAFAGHTVQVRFTSRPRSASFHETAAVFGEPVILTQRATPTSRPNVVLVSMDTLRARSIGVYGADRPTTPTIDALAGAGTVFDDAFSTAAFTLPGHMSMFTGLDVRDHAAVTMRTILDPAHRTLPEIFQSAGYATGIVTSATWIAPYLGFRRGADMFAEFEPPVAAPPVGLPCEAFTKGLDWMQANRDRPFFLFVHDYQVHRPYAPPAPYTSLFGPPPPQGPVQSDLLQYEYEQEVRYADDQLRALLEGIDALGLADRTLVVVTADHGEAFGEHGILEHTTDVHDEMTHVPLVMRLPGVVPAGRRIAEPVSLADVLPTLVDVAGLPSATDVDGTSLLPLLARTADRLPREGVFAQAQSGGALDWFDLTAIRTRTHACIDHGRTGVVECFDRRVDPWERFAPLPDDDSDADVRAARAALARYVAARPPLVPRWSTEGWLTGAGWQTDDSEDRMQHLRELGYVE